KGIVFDQKPESTDAPVAPNTIVTIYVSQGPPSVPMPDVIGMNKDDAVAELKGQTYQFTVTILVKDSPQKQDTVIDQDPLKDTPIAVGQSVTITVSHFVQPTPTPTNTAVPQPSPSPTSPPPTTTPTALGPGKSQDV
ncbi:MAG TPA: PASTA domain-containing protein, partial [Ktedonobacterales bacterium]|nr:PASTA domain-containing protein [Ktedonobacterales bacterium]